MDDPVDVQRRLAASQVRWRLLVGESIAGGHSSSVFRCVMPDGSEAVLKLAATRAEAGWELAALRAWQASGRVVGVLDADVEAGAVLLQVIRPGTPLPSFEVARAVSVAADLLRHLHSAAPPDGLPVFGERYETFERRSQEDARYEQEVLGNSEPPGLRLLSRARESALELSATAPGRAFLHGDFIDKNILLAGRQYVVIDPMPMTGDPCSDVGFFAAYHPPASEAFECAAQLGVELWYDADRCARWTAVWLAHQACESWREDSDDLYVWASGSGAPKWLCTR